VISTLADYGTELTTGVKMFIAQSADVTQSFDNHHDRQLINKNRVEGVPFSNKSFYGCKNINQLKMKVRKHSLIEKGSARNNFSTDVYSLNRRLRGGFVDHLSPMQQKLAPCHSAK
jgi:hypothetical protein